MKAVILDGYAFNPGDLSWDELFQLADFTVYDRTKPEEVLARAHNAEAVFTNKVVFDRPVLDQLPLLRYIGVLATGYNVVDTAAAREKGIDVTNIPAYGTESVAQWTFTHLLNLSSKLVESHTAVSQGEWVNCKDYCFWKSPLIELAGKTLGIVGFGAIGRRVAALAQAFRMKVLAYGPHLQPGQTIDGVSAVSLDDLLAKSDFVSLHCPLNAGSQKMINAYTLIKMKRGACLINTGRGGLIDEKAVANALASGQLAGVGVDVLSTEPPLANNPLLTAKNCYITPHNAWATLEARSRLMATAIANFQAFLQGKPQNVVN